MPERNIEFGKFGARGIKGHEAVARQLDQLAGYIATPITARRGLSARILSDGARLVPLDPEEVAVAAKDLVRPGVEAIAVSLLHSYIDPADERAVGQVFAAVQLIVQKPTG